MLNQKVGFVQFKDWNDCSNSTCIDNCNKYTDNLKSLNVDTSVYDCNDLCKSVNLNDSNLEVSASTTDFGFGAATSCMCNGQKLMKELSGESGNGAFKSNGKSNGKYNSDAEGYWVGVSNTIMDSIPFNTNVPAGTALGGPTIASRYGQKYTSNCSSGNGGCGTCWKLTNKENTDQSINAVVIDTCEDANAYEIIIIGVLHKDQIQKIGHQI